MKNTNGKRSQRAARGGGRARNRAGQRRRHGQEDGGERAEEDEVKPAMVRKAARGFNNSEVRR